VSNFCLTAAFESSVPESSCRFVLVCLADQANKDGLAWPAVDSLVEMTGLSPRTVQKALRWLVEHRHISYADGNRSSGGAPGWRSTTRYYVHPVPCPVRAYKKDQRRAARGEQSLPGSPARETGEGRSGCAGATAAPVQPATERGATSNQRGATSDVRGATVAPDPIEPNRTVREPARTHEPMTSCRGSILEKKETATRPDIPPASAAEVFAFANGTGLPWTRAHAEHWFNHMEERGWMQGEAGTIPVRNWHAAARKASAWVIDAVARNGSATAPDQKKNKAAAEAEHSAILSIFREKFPRFSGEYRDIPAAERIAARHIWLERQKKERTAAA